VEERLSLLESYLLARVREEKLNNTMIKINLMKEGFNRSLRRMVSKKASPELQAKHSSKAWKRTSVKKLTMDSFSALDKSFNRGKHHAADQAKGQGHKKYKAEQKHMNNLHLRYMKKRAGITEGSLGQKRSIRKMASFAKKGDMGSFKKVMKKRLATRKSRWNKEFKDYKNEKSPGAVKFNKENPLDAKHPNRKEIKFKKI
jgi:hypothetical protein